MSSPATDHKDYGWDLSDMDLSQFDSSSIDLTDLLCGFDDPGRSASHSNEDQSQTEPMSFTQVSNHELEQAKSMSPTLEVDMTPTLGPDACDLVLDAHNDITAAAVQPDGENFQTSPWCPNDDITQMPDIDFLIAPGSNNSLEQAWWDNVWTGQSYCHAQAPPQNSDALSSSYIGGNPLLSTNPAPNPIFAQVPQTTRDVVGEYNALRAVNSPGFMPALPQALDGPGHMPGFPQAHFTPPPPPRVPSTRSRFGRSRKAIQERPLGRFIPSLPPPESYEPDPAYDEHPVIQPATRLANLVRANAKYMPHHVYIPLGKAPRSWNCFRYTNDGQLNPAQLYTAEEITYYLFKHPLHHGVNPKTSNLQILLQGNPTNCGDRYPSALSHRCRFKECPLLQSCPTSTIQPGQWQVAFDELHATHLDHDPFIVAGYVHLWCLERFCDFPRICRELNVSADARRLPVEKYGVTPMRNALGKERTAEVTCEEVVIHEFIEQCLTNTLVGYPSHTEENRPHSGTLVHKLAVQKLSHEARSVKRQRANRVKKAGYEGSMLTTHMGDLALEADIRYRTRKHVNQTQWTANPKRIRAYANHQPGAEEDSGDDEDEDGDEDEEEEEEESESDEEGREASPAEKDESALKSLPVSTPTPPNGSKKRHRKEVDDGFCAPVVKRQLMDSSQPLLQSFYPPGPHQWEPLPLHALRPDHGPTPTPPRRRRRCPRTVPQRAPPQSTPRPIAPKPSPPGLSFDPLYQADLPPESGLPEQYDPFLGASTDTAQVHMLATLQEDGFDEMFQRMQEEIDAETRGSTR